MMEDNNKSQKENSPIVTAAMPSEGAGRSKHVESSTHSRSYDKNKDNKPLIIGIVAGIVVVVLAGVLIAVGISNRGEQISESEYSIQRDPETGERPLFGSDPNKDNSGDAYIKYLQRIINANDTTNAERFDAYVSMAVYYNAVNEFDKALEAMSKLTANSLSEEQLVRFYNVYANIYEKKGDTAKAEEYRRLASGEGQTTEAVVEQTEVIEQEAAPTE